MEVELADARREVLAFEARPPAWSLDVLNAIQGAGRGARERRDGWIAEHWLDVHAFDRTGDYDLHGWLAHRGIAAEAHGYNEYQETIHFVEPGALEWFERNGIARGPFGAKVPDPHHGRDAPGWARRYDWNAWITTNTDPRWAAVIAHDQATSPLLGDAISQDNVGTATARIGTGPAGRFGRFDQLRFDAWLRHTGRADPFGMPVRAWIAQRRAGDFRALLAGERDAALLERLARDPALSDYHLAQHVTQLQAWVRHYRDLRRLAARAGRDFDVHGNLGGSFVGLVPYAVVVGDAMDTIWWESTGWSEADLVEHDRANAWGPFRFQLSEAIAGPGRTWTALSRSRRATPDLQELEWAEASAGGAVVLAQSSRFAERPELLERLGALLRLRERHRAVFEREGRRRFARVGLLYSVPTHLYAQFVPRAAQPVVNDLAGAARALEQGHVPYRVVLLGHPELRPDRFSLADLSGLDVVVAPSLNNVSEAHLRVLEAYLRGGGTVLALGRFGERDEQNRPRTARRPALERLRAAGRVLRPLGDASYPSSRSPNDARARERARRVLAAVRGVPGAAPIAPGLPERLWVRGFQHRDGLLSLHFTSYDFERASGRVRRSPPGVLDVALPADAVADEATWLAPGAPPRALPVSLASAADGVRRARVELPAIDVQGVLVLGPAGREREASALRRGDHLRRRALRASGDHPVPPAWRALAALRRPEHARRYADAAERLLRRIAAERDGARVRSVAAAAEPGRAVRSFDFGKARRPSRGRWLGVGPDTHYEPARGYGWLESRDDSQPTPAERWYRSLAPTAERAQEIRGGWLPGWPYREAVAPEIHAFVYATRGQRFRVDLPDGLYRVRVAAVGPYPVSLRVSGAISVDGTTRLLDVPLARGEVRERAFVARARQGRIVLDLGGAAGFGVAALHLEPVATRTEDPAAGGALRAWRVGPRHPNPDWVGFDDLAAPGAARVGPAAVPAAWRELSAAREGLGVIDLGTLAAADPGDVVYASAQIPVRARAATLVVGASSGARVWIDGRLRARIPNAPGVEFAEAAIPLAAGPAQRVTVELMRFWERRWQFHASVIPGRDVAPRDREGDL